MAKSQRDVYDIRDDMESDRQWLGKNIEWDGIRAFKELATHIQMRRVIIF